MNAKERIGTTSAREDAAYSAKALRNMPESHRRAWNRVKEVMQYIPGTAFYLPVTKRQEANDK